MRCRQKHTIENDDGSGDCRCRRRLRHFAKNSLILSPWQVRRRALDRGRGPSPACGRSWTGGLCQQTGRQIDPILGAASDNLTPARRENGTALGSTRDRRVPVREGPLSRFQKAIAEVPKFAARGAAAIEAAARVRLRRRLPIGGSRIVAAASVRAGPLGDGLAEPGPALAESSAGSISNSLAAPRHARRILVKSTATPRPHRRHCRAHIIGFVR